MNLCVIVPAAGAGRRFGTADKLAQDLGGRPLLIRTVELFARRDEVRSIVVAGPPATAEAPDAFEAFREKYAATLGFHGADVVEGSPDHRGQSVRNALAEVPEDATHIAVHDAARPGTSADLLGRILDAAATLPAVVPARPIAATVKRVEAEVQEVRPDEEGAIADSILGEAGRVVVEVRRVRETLDRAGLVEVQTPQVFHADLLRRAYAAEAPAGATDDAALVERLGEPVYVVQGEARNFKVTVPEDLVLMRAVLNVKPPAERPVHKRF